MNDTLETLPAPEERSWISRTSALVRCVLLLAVFLAFAGPACGAVISSSTVPALAGDESSASAPEKSAATEAPASEASSVSGAAPEKAVVVKEPPLSQQPYDVTVVVGYSGGVTEGQAFQDWCTAEVRRGLSRMYGGMWNANVISGGWLTPAGKTRLERITSEELIGRYPEGEADKVILLSVESRDGVFVLSGAEFDVRVQEITPVISETTLNQFDIPAMTCRLARDCFRPVLILLGPSVPNVPQEFELELQAGAFTAPDPTAAQIAEGDILRTFVRQMDRKNPGKLKRMQRLDLCYVRVQEFNRLLAGDGVPAEDKDLTIDGKAPESSVPVYDTAHVRGLLISHGPVPFGGRSRAQQQIALRQRPSARSSRVQLVLQDRPDRPLICFRVDKVPKLRYQDPSDAPAQRILTDRNGELEIAVDPEHPTFWLYVYSGSLLLARVPYAPGLIPRDTIKLPDDSLRLGVEGELYMFRDKLVDSVAEKAVTMSLAKKASAAGDIAGFEDAVRQLDEQPGLKEFEQELSAIRTLALESPEAKENKTLARKIERLCTAMQDSLKRFFASDRQIQDASELQKMRDAVEERAATLPPTN